MDTKYNSTADMACSEEHEGSKFATSIAFLYNDYDYSSTILIDDSSNPKTEISGNNVTIESTIYQPYRRPEALVDDLKSAWEKVCEYFKGSTHEALAKKVSQSFDKLFTLVKDPLDMTSSGNAQQMGQVWREVVQAFESLYDLIKNEAIVTEDSILGRLIDSVKACLEFKEYTNYVNVNVSSGVSTDDAGDDQPFGVSGSVYIGNNTAKSNIFVGKNDPVRCFVSLGSGFGDVGPERRYPEYPASVCYDLSVFGLRSRMETEVIVLSLERFKSGYRKSFFVMFGITVAGKDDTYGSFV
jgi:hypothetical protein